MRKVNSFVGGLVFYIMFSLPALAELNYNVVGLELYEPSSNPTAVTLKVTKHCGLDNIECAFVYKHLYFILSDIEGESDYYTVRVMIAGPPVGFEGPLVVMDGFSKYFELSESRTFPATAVDYNTPVRVFIRQNGVKQISADMWNVGIFYRARFTGKDGLFYNQFKTINFPIRSVNAPVAYLDALFVGGEVNPDGETFPLRGEAKKVGGPAFSEWVPVNGRPSEEYIIQVKTEDKVRVAIFDLSTEAQ